MKKTIVENAEGFILALQNVGYMVTTDHNLQIKKGNCELKCESKNKPQNTWSRAPKTQTGFLIKKPYFLLKNFERANSGQILINFGKSLVEDVLLKIEEMFDEIDAYNIQQNKKRDLVAIATDFLTAESAKWEETKPNYPYGFRLIINPDSENMSIQLLHSLGVKEVYYSYKDKKFVLTGRSICYDKRFDSIDWYSENEIDLLKLYNSVEHMKNIQSLINNLNENI